MTRLFRSFLIGCSVFSFLCVPLINTAWAQDSPEQPPKESADEEAQRRAKEYYDKGAFAFRVGRFEEAIEWFEKAFQEVQYPEFLLNIGQAYKELDRCDKAIFLYKQYLRLGENIDREGTEALIAICEEELRNNPSTEPATTPSTQPSTTPTPIPTTEPVIDPVVTPEEPLPSPLRNLSLEARALFASGSVGSVETGGRNVFGPGVAVFFGALFPVSERVYLGIQGGVEGHTTGVILQGETVNSLKSSADFRGSAHFLGEYTLSERVNILGNGGVVLGAAGSSGLALRVGGAGLLNGLLPVNAKLLFGLHYELGGVSQGVADLLGCNNLCLYQQLSVDLGIRIPFGS